MIKRFISFRDYADNVIIEDEYPTYIETLPNVGDFMSWFDPTFGRFMAKVVDIKETPNETVFKMGRTTRTDSIDTASAIPLGKMGLEYEFIIKAK